MDGDDLEVEDLGSSEPFAADPGFDALLEKLHLEHDFDFREYKEASLRRRIDAAWSRSTSSGSTSTSIPRAITRTSTPSS